ncbi:PstS family phosphate ABC transporter substrate-binding protein [Planococcus sp. 107-1]|uniref:PstS family phosphate ABC transporter substrate-binding protein n=1 Tax=Planococcus sp. 107-1 TaxID=2908840 RepID=UPI001F264729|nr:substrate-binding domain-containing protein [Planococcus sp. 107-1]UJF27303.1 substrate-binding domain-containing protein [Planococcus sp. 107-1]
MNAFVKLLITLAAVAAMLAVFVFGGIYVLNTGEEKLLVLLGAVIVSMMILLIYILERGNGKKTAIWISLCLLVGIGFAAPYYYKESFAKVDDSEVDLFVYEPFKENEKLARLDSKASFAIEGELPILDGATALYPLFAAFAEATYPEGVYEPHRGPVATTTTPSAYSRLIKGNADIIFAAEPSIGQLQDAKEAGVELELTPIGREAFVFFVNSRNKISDLSSEDICGIYSGDIENWKELGGKNDEIRPFQRPEDSGSQTMFIKFMGDTEIEKPETENLESGMGGIIEEVASYRNYKNAIGYTFRFYSTEMVKNDKIKLLSIDGIEPSIENIRSSDYPLASEFYAITAGSKNPNVEPFLEWILSGEGQKLVEDTGFVPVK